jgi:phage-related protein
MATKQIIWFDANNNQFNLDSTTGVHIFRSLKGFYMPPFSVTEDEIPFQAGSLLRNIKVSTRELELPVMITGTSNIDFNTKIRNFINAFNPMVNNGKLRVISYDGSQREIYCRYLSGFEMDESVGGDNWQRAVGVFKAFDPYWYDANTIVQTFNIGTTATFFPFFPLRLTSSTVFADTTINNSGDLETLPTWTINGPGDTIFLRNLTTGEVANINTSLGVGESIVVDTRQGVKTITKNDGTNLYPFLSNDSILWSLRKGSNQVRIEMQNATSNSSVQLNYQNRYWSC